MLAAAAGHVPAAEPSQRDASPSPSPQKQLQGLGFSIAPKEGGKGRTSLFGLIGEGYKFVYVFDRSAAWADRGETRCGPSRPNCSKASKTSIRSTSSRSSSTTNGRRFSIPPARPAGSPSPPSRTNSERFASSSRSPPSGGTDHEEALKLAIRLQPDVIFFLTDGDDPKLTPAQLAKIRHLAAGIVINAIEFGPGPKPAGDEFSRRVGPAERRRLRLRRCFYRRDQWDRRETIDTICRIE